MDLTNQNNQNQQCYIDHADDQIHFLQRRYIKDYGSSARCARNMLHKAERLMASTARKNYWGAHKRYQKLYDMAYYRLTAAISWGV